MKISLYLSLLSVCGSLASCGQSNENISQSMEPVKVNDKIGGSVQQVAADQPMSLIVGAASAKQDSVKEFCIMGTIQADRDLLEGSSASEIENIIAVNGKSVSAEAIAELQKTGLIDVSKSVILNSEIEKLNRMITEISASLPASGLNCTPVVNSLKSELGIATAEEAESLNFWKYVVWGAINFGSFSGHDPYTQGQWFPEPFPTPVRIEQPYRRLYY